MKERAVQTAGKVVVWLFKRWGRMRTRIRCELSKVDKLVLNDHVGESDDSKLKRTRIRPHIKSQKSGKKEKVSR